MWVHEHELIDHRLNWLLVKQGLLFAAYGILLQITAAPNSSASQPSALAVLLKLLPLLGLVTSLAILFGVGAALTAMGILCSAKDAKSRATLHVHPLTTLIGWLEGSALPAVFLYAWYSLMPATVTSQKTPGPTISELRSSRSTTVSRLLKRHSSEPAAQRWHAADSTARRR